jgi:hypothetical protein
MTSVQVAAMGKLPGWAPRMQRWAGQGLARVFRQCVEG